MPSGSGGYLLWGIYPSERRRMVTLKAASDGMSEQGHGEKGFRGTPQGLSDLRMEMRAFAQKHCPLRWSKRKKYVFLLYLNVFCKFKIVSTGMVIQ